LQGYIKCLFEHLGDRGLLYKRKVSDYKHNVSEAAENDDVWQ